MAALETLRRKEAIRTSQRIRLRHGFLYKGILISSHLYSLSSTMVSMGSPEALRFLDDLLALFGWLNFPRLLVIFRAASYVFTSGLIFAISRLNCLASRKTISARPSYSFTGPCTSTSLP